MKFFFWKGYNMSNLKMIIEDVFKFLDNNNYIVVFVLVFIILDVCG